MDSRIASLLEDYWRPRHAELTRQVQQAAQRLGRIVETETYHRRRSGDPAAVGGALGAFAGDTVDARALSERLQSAATRPDMPPERLERVQYIAHELERNAGALQSSPSRVRIVHLEGDVQAVLAELEQHVDSHAKLVRLLRMAQLEGKALYDATVHDPAFERFDWRGLTAQETALCPPFVVVTDKGSDEPRFYADLLQLVGSGRPVKVVVRHAHAVPLRVGGNGHPAAPAFAPALELAPMWLRHAFFVQAPALGNGALLEPVARGLASARPAVFSVLAANGAPARAGERARLAVATRAFPQVVYDPDAAPAHVACLDLSANPEPERVWPRETLDCRDGAGGPHELEREVTVADFLAAEPEGSEHFTGPPPGTDEAHLVPLAEYLRMEPEQRRALIPFIHALDAQGQPAPLVPSTAVVAVTLERRGVWQALQELGGLANPHVEAARAAGREEARAEAEQSRPAGAEQDEQVSHRREQEAVRNAMRKLVYRLSGLDAAGLNLQDVLLEAAGAPAQRQAPSSQAPAAQAQAASDEGGEGLAWVEQSECTTCDECITINRRIFAYNRDKKAYVKDAAAGPFRDIVKAAEKCPSLAIHPGRPANPGEADLGKWMQRAEPFQ